MFSELEGNEFSEVNRAMVVIISCIYSCSTFRGSAPCRECGAASTFVQLIVVLFVLSESLFSGNCLLLTFLS